VPRFLKSLVCGALTTTGLDSFLASVSGASTRPWVTGYHTVVEDHAALSGLMPGLAITAATFEAQVDWMARRFDLIAVDDMPSTEQHGQPRRPGQKPLAAITFDDGYRGVYDFALPILQRKGIPASMFVVTDRVGDTRPLAHDRIFRILRRRRPVEAAHEATRTLLHTLANDEIELVAGQDSEAVDESSPELPATWPMILALRDAGWTIGSHSRTHARLVACSPDEMRDEVRGSREMLADRLGRPVRHFAYPDGAFTPDSVEAIAEAGFTNAYTTCSHRDSRYPALTYPRTMLWEGSSIDAEGRVSPAILSVQASGAFELVAGCRVDHASVHH
jgi:peptidoglycan/xylan/chitin deacetylase (PgdA/CDA1 family)